MPIKKWSRHNILILPLQLLGLLLLVQLTNSIDIDELVEKIEDHHESQGKSRSKYFDPKFNILV